MNHTPGPWFQGFSDGRRVVDGNGASVAWTYTARNGRPHSEVKANARLISAAPELLEACKEAMVLGSHGVGSVNTSDDPDCKANAERNMSECIRIMRVLSAAIAKAEGRTQ